MTESPRVAYKVLTAEQMAAFTAAGGFHGAPGDRADGFIHLSSADQVTETVNKHFSGQTELVIAAVDLDALGAAVRWEPSRGGQLFPHIYGDLPQSAVIAQAPLVRTASGEVVLPA